VSAICAEISYFVTMLTSTDVNNMVQLAALYCSAQLYKSSVTSTVHYLKEELQ